MTTLVLEDGTGLPNANAYASADEIAALLEVNPAAAATWSALSADGMDSYAVWASWWLDNYVQWSGYKAIASSGMRWPRIGVFDRDGILIAADTIPDQLKQATAETAVWLITYDAAQPLPEGIKRVKADVVEIEFFDSAAADSRNGSNLMPVNIRFLIKGLGKIILGPVRVAEAVR